MQETTKKCTSCDVGELREQSVEVDGQRMTRLTCDNCGYEGEPDIFGGQ